MLPLAVATPPAFHTTPVGRGGSVLPRSPAFAKAVGVYFDSPPPGMPPDAIPHASSTGAKPGLQGEHAKGVHSLK